MAIATATAITSYDPRQSESSAHTG
eukprot:SAG31_NODE_37640_length_302_cov_1.270936_1_plen_24_part_10